MKYKIETINTSSRRYKLYTKKLGISIVDFIADYILDVHPMTKLPKKTINKDIWNQLENEEKAKAT